MGVVSDFREIGTAIHNNWLNFIVTGLLVWSLYKYTDSRFEKIDVRFEKIDARFEKLENKLDKAIEKMDHKIDIQTQRIDEVMRDNQAMHKEIMELIKKLP